MPMTVKPGERAARERRGLHTAPSKGAEVAMTRTRTMPQTVAWPEDGP
jgi:hypothetical protein